MLILKRFYIEKAF